MRRSWSRGMYHLICQARVKLTLLLPWSIDRRSNCCPDDAAACRSMLLCDQSLTTLHVSLDAVVGNCVHKSWRDVIDPIDVQVFSRSGFLGDETKGGRNFLSVAMSSLIERVTNLLRHHAVNCNEWTGGGPPILIDHVIEWAGFVTACSFGLSATSQQYFSLRINQSPTISQRYFSPRTNQYQSSTTSQTNRLLLSYY
jgi:hypothetical protein